MVFICNRVPCLFPQCNCHPGINPRDYFPFASVPPRCCGGCRCCRCCGGGCGCARVTIQIVTASETDEPDQEE